MDSIEDFKTWKRESLIEWLQTNDGNGIYTDELATAEGYEPLTKIGALNIINRQLFNDDAEFLDLFEHYDLLPPLVQQLLMDNAEEDNTYNNCEKLLLAVESLGFTFDYYLDAVPFGLREMGAEDKEQHKKKMAELVSDWQEATARNNDKRSFDAWLDDKYQD